MGQRVCSPRLTPWATFCRRSAAQTRRTSRPRLVRTSWWVARSGPAVLPFWQLQSRVAQIQPVHDLVVVVPRRRVLVPREGVAVRPLEVDHPPPLLVKERVMPGVVKRVVVVG